MFYVYLFVAAIAVIVFVIHECRPAKCYGCGLPADNGTAWCMACQAQRDTAREEADRKALELYNKLRAIEHRQACAASYLHYVEESVAHIETGCVEEIHPVKYPYWSN